MHISTGSAPSPYNYLMETKASWKSKIDPALDKLIRAYLFMLEDTELIRNSGWACIKDEYISMWEKTGSQGWYKEYEDCIAGISKQSKTVSMGLVSKKRYKKELKGKTGKFRNELFKTLEELPAESQEYYKNKLRPFYSDNPSDKLPPDLKKDELAEILQDFYVNYSLLIMHKMAADALGRTEPSDKEIMKMLSQMLFSINNTISLVVFGKNIFELIQDAKSGNQKSFFKALQIDRSIIESNWAIKMIRKAQLSGDESFFMQMAKAITKQPFKHDKEFTKAIMAVVLFWQFGFNKLTNSEQMELLEECGIRVQDDPEVFRKFVSRLVKSNQSSSLAFPSQA